MVVSGFIRSVHDPVKRLGVVRQVPLVRDLIKILHLEASQVAFGTLLLSFVVFCVPEFVMWS